MRKNERKAFLERNSGKRLILDALIAAVLLFLDQFTKYLAITHLKDQPAIVLIDGVLELQYLENRGSAFSLLQGQKFIILAIGFAVLAVLIFVIVKLPQNKKFRIVHILLSALIAGALGNIIDRLRFDYVVDFISFVLIHFPVFNVADCFIVCIQRGRFKILIIIKYIVFVEGVVWTVTKVLF